MSRCTKPITTMLGGHPQRLLARSHVNVHELTPKLKVHTSVDHDEKLILD
jgi:hypothetical protein